MYKVTPNITSYNGRVFQLKEVGKYHYIPHTALGKYIHFKVSLSVGHVYSVARSKLNLARGSSVIHVPCDANSVANYLAQFTKNIVGSQV